MLGKAGCRLATAAGLIILIFLGLSTLAMVLHPASFAKYFSGLTAAWYLKDETAVTNYYWDVEHYADFAINSQCYAFYPLWPLLVRALWQPTTLGEAAFYLRGLGAAIAIGVIPLLLAFLHRLTQDLKLAFWITLLFALNQNSLFRFIGYTESLFSLLSLGLCWGLWRLERSDRCRPQPWSWALVAGSMALLSLTRPCLVQTVAAAGATSITLWCIHHRDARGLAPQRSLILSTLLTGAAMAGYACYGAFCWWQRGSFLAPFYDQKDWNRELQFHPELLLGAKAFLFDLLALYWPLLLLGLVGLLWWSAQQQRSLLLKPMKSPGWMVLGLYPPLLLAVIGLRQRFGKPQPTVGKPPSTAAIALGNSYLCWFSLYFCLSHGLIVLFSQDDLYSLGRFVFSTPFFFVGLACGLQYLPKVTTRRWLQGFSVVSGVTLVQHWITYGQDKWLG